MDAVTLTMMELSEQFNKQMGDFQKKLEALTPPDTAPTKPNTVAALTAEFYTFRDFVLNALKALHQQVALLSKMADDHEMNSRRKILLFHGIDEHDKEDVTAVITKVLADKVKVSDINNGSIISRCHRLGGKVKDKSKPRPILVKFSQHAVKDRIWRGKTCLKGSGIMMSEFLTKERHNIFMKARKHFGVEKCWTHNGSIFALSTDGVLHRFLLQAELDKFIGASATSTAVAATTTAVAATATAVAATTSTPVDPIPSVDITAPISAEDPGEGKATSSRPKRAASKQNK